MGRLNGRRKPHCAVGRLIDRVLLERGWYQFDLAQVLSCQVAYISAIVVGTKGIGPDTAKALAVALALDPMELLKAQDAETLARLPPDEAKFAAIRQRAQELDHLIAAAKAA